MDLKYCRKVRISYKELCSASVPVEKYLYYKKGVDIRKPFYYRQDRANRDVLYFQHPIYSSFKWRYFGNMGWVSPYKEEEDLKSRLKVLPFKLS